MYIPNFERFIVESSVTQLAKSFVSSEGDAVAKRIGTETFGPLCVEPGACSAVSYELIDYLVAHGTAADAITVQFDRKVNGNSDGDWHTAVVAGSIVIDLTIGQFSRKRETFTGTVGMWLSRLAAVTGAKPTVRR